MTNYYYMHGSLHTYESLLHSQLYRVAHDMPTDHFMVEFNDDENGSLGCVLIHTVTGLPLSGRPAHRAQLNADRPPRIYPTPQRAAVAVATIGKWSFLEFDLKHVHEVK